MLKLLFKLILNNRHNFSLTSIRSFFDNLYHFNQSFKIDAICISTIYDTLKLCNKIIVLPLNILFSLISSNGSLLHSPSPLPSFAKVIPSDYLLQSHFRTNRKSTYLIIYYFLMPFQSRKKESEKNNLDFFM